MAEKRMFSKSIIDSDVFLSMPLSTQALYFHLSMRADDEGFVDKAKSIAKIIGANEDDLKLLLAKRYILAFNSGVVVIKHWWIHNYIRKDRIQPTNYQEELSQITIKNNKSYTEISNVSQMSVKCQSNVSIDKISIDKNSIDKNSIDKNSIDKNSIDKSNSRFTPPTIEEVKAYCKERNNNIDSQRFIDFYESKGWMIGKNKMKDWKAAVRTWENKDKKNNGGICDEIMQRMKKGAEDAKRNDTKDI